MPKPRQIAQRRIQIAHTPRCAAFNDMQIAVTLGRLWSERPCGPARKTDLTAAPGDDFRDPWVKRQMLGFVKAIKVFRIKVKNHTGGYHCDPGNTWEIS